MPVGLVLQVVDTFHLIDWTTSIAFQNITTLHLRYADWCIVLSLCFDTQLLHSRHMSPGVNLNRITCLLLIRIRQLLETFRRGDWSISIYCKLYGDQPGNVRDSSAVQLNSCVFTMCGIVPGQLSMGTWLGTIRYLLCVVTQQKAKLILCVQSARVYSCLDKTLCGICS